MGVYERLGVRPIINARGTNTRLGGAQMEQAAIEAMAEAAQEAVPLEELQAAASNIIAKITGAEAGYVTSGASAALTLGMAACLTGLDVARMNRLPHTAGMPNEVLMARHQVSGYDHAISAAGAKIVEVGMPNDTTPPMEVHITEAWEFEAAITENTVAIAYAARPGGHPPLEEVIDIGKRYHIPVLLDAAAQVPPVENLRKFIAMGADLIAFSGGKGIRGPQASGILCGRRDLIAATALQNLDMAAIAFDTWNPPPSFIPKEKLRGVPQHGIGRSMKVTKEAIVGLLAALQLFTEEKVLRDLKRSRSFLEQIAQPLKGVSGVEMKWTEYISGGEPMLVVKLDEVKLGRSAAEVSQRLQDGAPPIYVRESRLQQSMLIIYPGNLNEERAKIVEQRLYSEITKK
ncbi:D-glucosaminate-6-phosphate ammonia lyase [subsurface metagenome]